MHAKRWRTLPPSRVEMRIEVHREPSPEMGTLGRTPGCALPLVVPTIKCRPKTGELQGLARRYLLYVGVVDIDHRMRKADMRSLLPCLVAFSIIFLVVDVTVDVFVAAAVDLSLMLPLKMFSLMLALVALLCVVNIG